MAVVRSKTRRCRKCSGEFPSTGTSYCKECSFIMAKEKKNTKQRKCLGCLKMFSSSFSGNRMCLECKNLAEEDSSSFLNMDLAYHAIS